ncbi:unnamed protein product [Ectocarpus sp. 13 AM-2016]
MRARGWHGRGMPSGSMSRLDKKTQEGSRRVEPRRRGTWSDGRPLIVS